MRRIERVGVALAVLLLVVLPILLHGWPTSLEGNLFTALMVCGGLALMGWREHPRLSSILALGLLLASLGFHGWFPDTGITLFSAAFAVLALGWSGRAAWLVGALALAYVALLYLLTDQTSWVAPLMFTVPSFAAGTALRLRNETARRLARRARELEDERELYAEIALRHERARIAGELHDIVGHALSVLVIQAAAGQRLAENDPERADAAFAAISDSARQGTRDLQRLLELLGSNETPPDQAADLSLIDELVERASRTGLRVACRLEGDRDGVPGPVAHLAFRVVQESLTNALRYAPGAQVRIAIRVDGTGHGLVVRVDNDGVLRGAPALVGTGRGLIGLRERVSSLGGQFRAGIDEVGGWSVEAHLPGASG